MNQFYIAHDCKLLSDGLKRIREEFQIKEQAILGHMRYLQNLCKHPHHEPAEDEGKTIIKLTFCPNCGKEY